MKDDIIKIDAMITKINSLINKLSTAIKTEEKKNETK
jgi:hypothetical protein